MDDGVNSFPMERSYSSFGAEAFLSGAKSDRYSRDRKFLAILSRTDYGCLPSWK